MIFRLPSFSRILAVLFLLVAVMPAQRGEGGELTAEQIQAMRGKRAKAGKTKEAAETDVEIGEKWAAMTPEQRLAANVRRGSTAHCQFSVACRPPKLLPGQSGVMMITAILKGDAVLPAPLQMTMTPRVRQGSVVIGDLAPRPASPGTIAKAYLGRPVYDNTVVIEVPVTIGADAQLGTKVSIAMDLNFDIYDGGSGQTIGRFIERVTTDVEIAPHADPQVAGRANRPQVEPVPVIAAEPAKKDASSANTAKPANKVMSGVAAEVPVGGSEPVEVDVPDAAGDLPPTEAGGAGLPYMLMIGGGAFLLVIVLLLMRKK